MNFKKIYSILMLLIIASQVFANTLLTASEIASQVIASEEVTSETQVETSNTTKTSTRAIEDYSGLGNQNTSDIGKATYLHPNEETDASLKTVEELQAEDADKYISVTDLNADLVEEVIKGTDMSEGILPFEFDPSLSRDEISARLANAQRFEGDCWSDTWRGNRQIIDASVSSLDTCDYYLENFGNYYNTQTMEFYTVDLKLTVNYLDFYSSGHQFSVGAEYWQFAETLFDGLTFDTQFVEELEFTMTIMDKEGKEINVPILYKLSDVDLGSTLGFESNSIYKLATYYQDETSATEEYNHDSTQSTFNYMSFFDYFTKLYDDGEISLTTYLRSTNTNSNDRSIYNDHPDIDNASGQYTVEERSWNRIKFQEKDGYITAIDSWGTNTGDNGFTQMKNNGKDGEVVIAAKSTLTLTSNMPHTFFGKVPSLNQGFGQSFVLNPYRAVGETIVEKYVTDGNNEIAEVGDTLTYTIDVTNVSTLVTVFDVEIRDSLLENLPEYLSWDGTVTIDGEVVELDPDNVEIILPAVVPRIDPSSQVSIVYQLVVNDIPNDLFSIDNVVTNNGEDPAEYCDVNTTTPECGATSTPVSAPTTIEKSVVDGDDIGYAIPGETLSYTIKVTNEHNSIAADNVVVRDNLLENLPSYLSWDGNYVVSPGVSYNGQFEDGTFTLDTLGANSSVEITYDLVVKSLPADGGAIVNIVTDNGIDPLDPNACLNVDDCAEAQMPLDGETTISKSVIDSSGNGIIESDELLTYTIEVTNPSELATARDVTVRDSMLETINTYDFLKWDQTIIVEPTTIKYSGMIDNGTLKFDEIAPGQTVKIIYQIQVGTIPKDIMSIINVATDNDDNPLTKQDCKPNNDDCAKTTTRLQGETEVVKSLKDENNDGIVERGELLTYTLEISNSTINEATNVMIRDSLLEQLPTWLTYNDDVKLNDETIGFTGSLSDGNFTIYSIEPNASVTITYTLTVGTIPSTISNLVNIVTDNGDDPNTIDPKDCETVNCSSVTTPVNPSVVLKKTVSDQNGNGIIEPLETLTYTITVKNESASSQSTDVVIRDSMLEHQITWLTYNDDMSISPKGLDFSGKLDDAGLTISVIEPGQTITITYTLTATATIQEDVEYIVNIATSNGLDPTQYTVDSCQELEVDCASASILGSTKMSLQKTGNKIAIMSVCLTIILASLLFLKQRVND